MPESSRRSEPFVGNGPASLRFTLVHVGFEEGMEKEELGYVTSWDTWEESSVAFDPRMPVGFRLIDNETGRVWHPGAAYEWEAAQT